MHLQRYHLWCIKKLTASKSDYIVKFNGRKNIQSPVIFASPLIISNATLASQYLSLTYLPRHRYDFDSSNNKLLDNEGNEITTQNPNDFLRVWPAFGKYGGGIEVLVELNNSKITPLSDNILLDGGSFDRFHQDAILPMTKQILMSIVDGTREIFENETGIGSVRSGLPIFKWQLNQDNFTISVGYKETPDGMILHIWGTKWRDFNSFRCLCSLLQSEFQAFQIGRSELEKRFKKVKDPLFVEFSNKIKDVVKGLQKCKDPEHPFMRCFEPLECIVRLP